MQLIGRILRYGAFLALVGTLFIFATELFAADENNDKEAAEEKRRVAMLLLTPEEKAKVISYGGAIDDGRTSAEDLDVIKADIIGPLHPFLLEKYKLLTQRNPGELTKTVDEYLHFDDDERWNFMLTYSRKEKAQIAYAIPIISKALKEHTEITDAYARPALRYQVLDRERDVYTSKEFQESIKAENRVRGDDKAMATAVSPKERPRPAASPKLPERAPPTKKELVASIARHKSEIGRLDREIRLAARSGQRESVDDLKGKIADERAFLKADQASLKSLDAAKPSTSPKKPVPTK